MTNEQTPDAKQAKKKGLSPLAWIAIAAGSLLVLGMIAVAAIGWFAVRTVSQMANNPAKAIAEIAIKANPDLDIVSTDDGKGTMTIRNEKTGKQITLSFEDIKEGKFSFKSDEGEVKLDVGGGENGASMTVKTTEGEVRLGAGTGKLPDWVPTLEGASSPATAMTAGGDKGASGAFTQTTDAPVGDVVDRYADLLKSRGFSVRKSTYSANNSTAGMVNATAADKSRSITVMISHKDDQTKLLVTYAEGNR